MKLILLCILLVEGFLHCAFSIAECDSVSINVNKPASLYTDHGNGTVTDSNTTLMWQKCSLGLSGASCEISTEIEVDIETGIETSIDTIQLFTWQAALTVANTNTNNGYTDWRLPNVKELATLVENSCSEPSINGVIFPDTVSNIYWTSSPVVGFGASARSAWAVDFINGVIDDQYKFQEYSVRLVRNNMNTL